MTEQELAKAQDDLGQNISLEQGTYEILRNRLLKDGKGLEHKLQQLNTDRKKVFGSISTKLISTERISTDNNCIPVDMFPLGELFVFGYNVTIGLKSEVDVSDVFSVYQYADHKFFKQDLGFLSAAAFEKDFKNLYKYYKHTVFEKFAQIGPYLYLVFRVGKGKHDFKTFKWLISENTLEYIDNRSDHEYVFPDQHEFNWKRTTRDQHIKGKHPHISIEDKVFVETTEGDLTIKVENNTDSGMGIYTEEVNHKTQTLDDAEIYYAIIDQIIVLKIRPFQEDLYRYFVYNQKVQEVVRIDSMEESCVLLPDSHGIIFSNGYYLQTGEHKIFELEAKDMLFEQKIASPNGEDFQYVFFNSNTGVYVLLSYNLIEQKVEKPLYCNGFSIFDNGELCFFRSDEEAKKHHAIQIWQTPYISPNFEIAVESDSMLYKIGNHDLVRGMAECHEILVLLRKEDSYSNLYFDILKLATDILDSHYWLHEKDCFELNLPIKSIQETASHAIDEYEKVIAIRKSTDEQTQVVVEKVNVLLNTIAGNANKTVLNFVDYLSQLRGLRGEVISTKDLRYVDLQLLLPVEEKLVDQLDKTSIDCVEFLLKEEALLPYKEKIQEFHENISSIGKVIVAEKTADDLTEFSGNLEMLIEIVGSLKIHDATETTRIIENISALYAEFNQIAAALKNKKKELLQREGKAEFNSKIKLIKQGMVNYLDLCDTVAKCDDYMARLMIQLEDLEGKFADFPAYLDEIAERREDLYNSFETKKINLKEELDRKINALFGSAERVLKSVRNKLFSYTSVSEINAFFAADVMIAKIRSIVAELTAYKDTVKADDLQSQLKTLKEEAIRLLKDKQELYVDGQEILAFGDYKFSVNTQKLALTMVFKSDQMFYHLSGTNFFEKVSDPDFNATKDIWRQSLISENTAVYRAEFMAYSILQQAMEQHNNDELIPPIFQLVKMEEEQLMAIIHGYMSAHVNEAYAKGVHDADALRMLQQLIYFYKNIGLLRYPIKARVLANYFWKYIASAAWKETITNELNGVGALLKIFPESSEFNYIIAEIQTKIAAFCEQSNLFSLLFAHEAGNYLFHEIIADEHVVISKEASVCYRDFNAYLTKEKVSRVFKESLAAVHEEHRKFSLILNWLKAFNSHVSAINFGDALEECAFLILSETFTPISVIDIELSINVKGMKGSHAVLKNGEYLLNFNAFMHRLKNFTLINVAQFRKYEHLKKELIVDFEQHLRLDEFKPRVLSSFVRNKLINDVYLPIIGANLAKQIGVAGEGKRTDLMGLLLLISPPGYGKTTLMEYIASRLGIIFMKINGPAIGHTVVSLDPAEVKNAAAREELKKLALAFEMGDNVMIYLDDIQHCNPEFLQKFISLCDAQRKIEGVYKGQAKTYDFRGKKVCVIMAGNPYTESGERFQVPDMLLNRADVYNLGDIIGDTEDKFYMSYLENCITSNPILNGLVQKSYNDIYPLMQLAASGSSEGLDFEAAHSSAEMTEYVDVLKKLFVVRDVISKVNMAYINSASQADEYRTEPSFKLQGSYRDMNKIAEKVVPVLNEEELDLLVYTHYESESQTLTSDGEANLLKFKELTNKLNDKETIRLNEIREVFRRSQRMKNYGGNAVGRVVEEIENLGKALEGIQGSIEGNGKK